MSTILNKDEPPRRPKETEAQYNARNYRWRVWLSQEPRPDLWYTDDTEAAEYMAWAGTKKWHNNNLKSLINDFK